MRAPAPAVIAVLISSVVAFAAGRNAGTQPGEKSALHQKTKQNLETAMKGEAFAHAKYLLYAEQARKNGHQEVADLFERAAKMERMEHFREEAELANLVETDPENLRNAIVGESYETETMYKNFAEEARKVGDLAAAERFEEIRRDEAKHRDEFSRALSKLQGVGGAGTEGAGSEGKDR